MTIRHDELHTRLAAIKDDLIALGHDVEQLAATPNLSESIAQWVETRMLAEELKQAKKLLDDLVVDFSDDVIPHQLDLLGLTSAHHALGQVKLTHHTRASINQGRKAEAYAWLRAHDLGGIIIETINAQTLGATAKSLFSEGRDLPGDLFTVAMRRYAAFTSKE